MQAQNALINVTSTSTVMSTKLEGLSRIQTELAAAKKAGVSEQVIKVLQSKVDTMSAEIHQAEIDGNPTLIQYWSENYLFNRYNELKEWLVKHEAETGTGNLFDVNGQPYDMTGYENHLHELEQVEDEGRRRNIGLFYGLKAVADWFNPPLPPTAVSNHPGEK